MQFLLSSKGGASDVFCKNVLLTYLLGNQHLFEILQTSLTFKNNENVVKNVCDEERQFF